MSTKRFRGAAAAALAVKICRRCGDAKPLTDYYSSRSGRRPASTCRPCDAARARDRYWHNVDARRRRRRELRKADPERHRKYSRDSHRRHLDRNRERCRSYARSERGRQVNQKAVARWRAANPEKHACHRELRQAVRRGEVTRPPACEVRGCSSTGRLHGHHVNYRRPRDVIFACPRHHEAIHHDGPQPLKANVRKRKYARPPGISTHQ
jgi:hypothetical protein